LRSPPYQFEATLVLSWAVLVFERARLTRCQRKDVVTWTSEVRV
jgi:hypothetical protein